MAGGGPVLKRVTGSGEEGRDCTEEDEKNRGPGHAGKKQRIGGEPQF